MKNKSHIEIIKWLIGTVGLGFTSIFINAKIQNTELEIKRIEADATLLGVVTKNGVTNSASDSLELRYLSFVNTFITSEDIKEAVYDRQKELRGLLQINLKDAFIKSTQVQKKNVEAKITVPKKNELKENEESMRIEGTQVSINELSKKEDELVSNVTSIDSLTIINLNSAQKTITPSILKENKNLYGLIGDPITKWCKRGYYVEYNNSLRIGILDLAKQSITVNLKDIESEKVPPPIIKSSVILSNGETKTIDYNNYRYQIKLLYIGAAGKNPFTKAAYITVATYKKGSSFEK